MQGLQQLEIVNLMVENMNKHIFHQSGECCEGSETRQLADNLTLSRTIIITCGGCVVSNPSSADIHARQGVC